MELNDGLFFLQTELASLNIRSEIIGPSQSTALATPLKPYKHTHTQHSTSSFTSTWTTLQHYTNMYLHMLLHILHQKKNSVKYQLLLARHASFHDHVLRCKPRASDLLLESMVLSLNLPCRSMVIVPFASGN